MKPNQPTMTHAAGTVTALSIDQLRTSYAALRGGTPRAKVSQAAELPLRVVPTGKGSYEIIDGFKRLTRWRELGQELVPVVIERPASIEEHKRLLLEVNAPPRTLTALDEARVVCSLIDNDGKTEAQIARVLGRKKAWVARRVDIGRRLSPTAQQKLAETQIGPSLAHALCALEQKDQDLLLSALDRQGLGHQQALVLVSAYRVADAQDRRQLLRASKEALEPSPSPALSPVAIALEARLKAIAKALVDLAHLTIPTQLAPAEGRRLQALHRAVLGQLRQTAQNLADDWAAPQKQEDIDEHQENRWPNAADKTPPGGLARDPATGHRPETEGIRHPQDCSPCGPRAQSGPQVWCGTIFSRRRHSTPGRTSTPEAANGWTRLLRQATAGSTAPPAGYPMKPICPRKTC